MLPKFACPLVGAPVRPNMLNMPKSASGYGFKMLYFVLLHIDKFRPLICRVAV